MIDFQFSGEGQSMQREGVGLDCGEGGREAVRRNETKEKSTQRRHNSQGTYCVYLKDATHSSVLAWRIPGTVEPGGLPSMGSHRVGHG